jgi:hypothetical protein
MLNIVVHKNVRLSEIFVSDILGSDHQPVVFHFMHHVRTRNTSDPVDKFTDWERFKFSPIIQINSDEETDKAARDITASTASVYSLSTSKITISDLNKDL